MKIEFDTSCMSKYQLETSVDFLDSIACKFSDEECGTCPLTNVCFTLEKISAGIEQELYDRECD